MYISLRCGFEEGSACFALNFTTKRFPKIRGTLLATNNKDCSILGSIYGGSSNFLRPELFKETTMCTNTSAKEKLLRKEDRIA